MNLAWWCSGISDTNWVWQPSYYPGIWSLIIACIVIYFKFINPERNRKHTIFFFIGILLFWIMTDWPIGSIGAGYLLSIHVTQYLLYTFIIAPLLILSIPDQIYNHLLSSKIIKFANKIFLPFLLINLSLIITHVPFVANLLKSYQVGTMIIDFIWIFTALLFWFWIDPRFTKTHTIPFPLRLFFVFALSIIPTIPGAFFVFSDYPIYSTYEFAVPISSLSPLQDQEIAGLIMWAGSTPILLAWLGRIFYVWQKSEDVAN